MSPRLTRSRYWEDSTRRELAQIGIGQRGAQMLIDGIVPGGLDLQRYQDARFILDIRRSLRRRLSAPVDASSDGQDEAGLFCHASARIRAGEDVFPVLADLTVELVRHGFPERMPPTRYDVNFWTSQDDEGDLTAYLSGMDQTDVPEAA